MAKFVFGMNLSLDGYVDHEDFAPDPVLFHHWIEQVRRATASLYGRRIYEIMRYWDDDRPEWSAAERDFATAWRNLPKWVVSRSLVDVAGPGMAQSLSELGLIDEYRLYFHPVVLGGGKPFFAGPRRPLRLVASDRIGEAVIRLTYVPA